MEDSLLDKCVSFGHSTPSMAADVAYKLNAQHLILSHVSPRYRPISLWLVTLTLYKMIKDTYVGFSVMRVMWMIQRRCYSTKQKSIYVISKIVKLM